MAAPLSFGPRHSPAALPRGRGHPWLAVAQSVSRPHQKPRTRTFRAGAASLVAAASAVVVGQRRRSPAFGPPGRLALRGRRRSGQGLAPLDWRAAKCSTSRGSSGSSSGRREARPLLGGALRRAAFKALVAGGAVAAAFACGVPPSSALEAASAGVQPALAAALEFLQQAGWLGYAIHIVVFSLWISLSLPTTIIELATGFLYGPLWGFLCGICCKAIGQMNAFLVVATLRKRRGWQVPESLKPRLEAIRSRPLLAMVSVRLAPLPLGVKNYGLALCEVDFVPYMLAGVIVNMPFSILWALTGASCQSLGEALEMRGSYGGDKGKVGWAVAVLAVAAYAVRQLRSRAAGRQATADVPRAGDAAGLPCK